MRNIARATRVLHDKHLFVVISPPPPPHPFLNYPPLATTIFTIFLKACLGFPIFKSIRKKKQYNTNFVKFKRDFKMYNIQRNIISQCVTINWVMLNIKKTNFHRNIVLYLHTWDLPQFPWYIIITSNVKLDLTTPFLMTLN